MNLHPIVILLKNNIPTLPPIQFRHLRHPAFFKPRFIPQRREEMRRGEFRLQALDGRVAEVVVVVVTYDHGVDNG
jgi:hypothetical protein